MPSRRERANAIRALSMDAVQKKPTAAIPVPLWVWRISPKYFGVTT